MSPVSVAKSKTLDAFVGKVSSSLVSFDYSFTMPTRKAKMTGEGNVKVQGNSFKVMATVWRSGATAGPAGPSTGSRRRLWWSLLMIHTTAMPPIPH